MKYFYVFGGFIGWVFVITMAIWLSISENWWYFLVCIACLPLSKIAAIIIEIPWALLNPSVAKDPTDLFYNLRVKRIVGTLLIMCSVIACIFTVI